MLLENLEGYLYLGPSVKKKLKHLTRNNTSLTMDVFSFSTFVQNGKSPTYRILLAAELKLKKKYEIA